MLERIGLAAVADAWLAALSGGMQQRLAIAQAMAARPRILLLDAPFDALDPGTRLTIHAFLDELRRETGMTVFMVSHDLAEAFKPSDRVVVFDKTRRDLHAPDAYGPTITHALDARSDAQGGPRCPSPGLGAAAPTTWPEIPARPTAATVIPT